MIVHVSQRMSHDMRNGARQHAFRCCTALQPLLPARSSTLTALKFQKATISATGAPSNAIWWILQKSGNCEATPRLRSTATTSCAEPSAARAREKERARERASQAGDGRAGCEADGRRGGRARTRLRPRASAPRRAGWASDLCGDGALQLLSVEQVGLDPLPGAAPVRLGEGLGALAVAPAVAGRDQVGDAAALEEGLVLDPAVKHLRKLDRLRQAQPDDRGLRPDRARARAESGRASRRRRAGGRAAGGREGARERA